MMENAIVETKKAEVATLPTNEAQTFELMQREARLFSASPLIPDHLRKGGPEQAMANCYIALKMAKTMGEDPLVVLQNIHVVNGKAGFASQYVIARANSSGVFEGRINWRTQGEGDNLSVTAFAKLADTGEEVSFTCDMAMARAEGWTKNPKYKSMPGVMLRYRSAAFLVRFYAPDVMLGYQTAEEWSDVAAAGRAGPVIEAQETLTATMLQEQAAAADEEPETVDAEAIDPEPTEDIDQTPQEEADLAQQTLDDIDGSPEQDDPPEQLADEAPDPREAKFEEIKKAINATKTVIDLENLYKRERNAIKALTDEQREVIMRRFETAKKTLMGKDEE